jgi:hypothetical protein
MLEICNAQSYSKLTARCRAFGPRGGKRIEKTNLGIVEAHREAQEKARQNNVAQADKSKLHAFVFRHDEWNLYKICQCCITGECWENVVQSSGG